jgi:hypothetical protein
MKNFSLAILYEAALQDDDHAILYFTFANTPLCCLYKITPISEQLIKETTTQQEMLPAIPDVLKLYDAFSQGTD